MRRFAVLVAMALAAGCASLHDGYSAPQARDERAERFLFWPMGIASPGAMRQWGRQASALAGRRHFDDADLLERRFQLDLEGRGR